MILDRKGNIFGEFTPVKWESGKWHCKADDSLKSFVFMLKNPHNIPATRFPLKAERKEWTIDCYSGPPPCFVGGYGSDIRVDDSCNANTNSNIYLGSSYINNTELNWTGLEWSGQSCSQVHTIFRSKKSKSSRLPPKQPINQAFFSARDAQKWGNRKRIGAV
jgi:hypothetical protein